MFFKQHRPGKVEVLKADELLCTYYFIITYNVCMYVCMYVCVNETIQYNFFVGAHLFVNSLDGGIT